ncbi:hypothetical protein ABPG75_004099 [Micractinium tetrahymenae]
MHANPPCLPYCHLVRIPIISHSMAAPLSIACLPDSSDELLAHCLTLLDPAERHRSAALVCRRWAQLTQSPACLRTGCSEVAFAGGLNTGCGLERLLSFSAWVARRAAPHVADLGLSFSGLDEPVDIEQLQTAAALAATLAACGAAGSLRELRLEAALPIDPWLSTLHSLESLRISVPEGEGVIGMDAPLHLLSRLASLSLQFVLVAPSARLPPTLASLELDECGGEGLVTKMVTLPALCQLIVRSSLDPPEVPLDLGAAAASQLTRLTALERLELLDCPACPPACRTCTA